MFAVNALCCAQMAIASNERIGILIGEITARQVSGNNGSTVGRRILLYDVEQFYCFVDNVGTRR